MRTMQKTCIKCGVKKDVDCFYKRNNHSNLLDSRCKDCHKVISRENHIKNYTKQEGIDKYKIRKNSGKHILNFNSMVEKYPQKYKARYTLRNAVKYGIVKKLPCEICGSLKSQGHHSDYSKPLLVNWLCSKHHRELHRKTNEHK